MIFWFKNKETGECVSIGTSIRQTGAHPDPLKGEKQAFSFLQNDKKRRFEYLGRSDGSTFAQGFKQLQREVADKTNEVMREQPIGPNPEENKRTRDAIQGEVLKQHLSKFQELEDKERENIIDKEPPRNLKKHGLQGEQLTGQLGAVMNNLKI